MDLQSLFSLNRHVDPEQGRRSFRCSSETRDPARKATVSSLLHVIF